MSTPLIINSLGIILNIIGVIMVYIYSPINFHTIDGGEIGEEYVDPVPIVNRRNKLLKTGVGIVLLGSILQLFSNFL